MAPHCTNSRPTNDQNPTHLQQGSLHFVEHAHSIAERLVYFVAGSIGVAAQVARRVRLAHRALPDALRVLGCRELHGGVGGDQSGRRRY